MSKLTARGNKQDMWFKPKINLEKMSGQKKNNCHQDKYQNIYRSNSSDRRMSSRGRAK